MPARSFPILVPSLDNASHNTRFFLSGVLRFEEGATRQGQIRQGFRAASAEVQFQSFVTDSLAGILN